MLENPENGVGFLKSFSNTFIYLGKAYPSHETKYTYTHLCIHTYIQYMVFSVSWFSQFQNCLGKQKLWQKNINWWTEHLKNSDLNLLAQLTLASTLVLMDYFLSQPKSLTVKNWAIHYKYSAYLLPKIMDWFCEVSENDIEEVGKELYKHSSMLEAFPGSSERFLRDSWEKNVASCYQSIIWKNYTKKIIVSYWICWYRICE